MSEDEMRRLANDDEDVEAHKRIAVNDEPGDELRREDDDDNDVEGHLKKA